jgi:GrpB-like predicted nucleotidyltransferase (UPF0157 family)
MLRPVDITTFNDSPPPPGESPWASGQGSATEVSMVPHNPSWPARYQQIARLIRAALGPGVLAVAHVGSTSVPGLDAKPVIDVDLGGSDAMPPSALEAAVASREPL